MIFCFGAALFAHAATSISVAYFDQSMLFFWLTIAVISSIYSITQSDAAEVLVRPSDEIDLPDGLLDGKTSQNAEWRRQLRERMEQEGRRLTGQSS